MNKRSFSWIDPRLEVRNSPTHGIGTFATDFISKNDLVIVQGGRMATEKDFDDPEYAPFAYHCFQVEKDVYICPPELSESNLDGILKVNHSCSPTCGIRGQISMVAIRDISPGDEITFDYAMTDVGSHDIGWEDMLCNCGAVDCRKKITGEDWKIPELQKKYEGYFSKYVGDLINGQSN